MLGKYGGTVERPTLGMFEDMGCRYELSIQLHRIEITEVMLLLI